jgi:hypothetical protein
MDLAENEASDAPKTVDCDFYCAHNVKFEWMIVFCVAKLQVFFEDRNAGEWDFVDFGSYYAMACKRIIGN